MQNGTGTTMTDFVNDTPAALQWADEAIRRHSTGAFGKIVRSVIWSDERSDDGELLLNLDPHELVASISEVPFIILHGHDPGKPKGQVLESACFQTESGREFVAAILGYYSGGDVLAFRGLGLDTTAALPPANLPSPPADVIVQLATDPRDVEEAWLDYATSDAPVKVQRVGLSHNAENSAQELLQIGIAFVFLVWNPFVTAIASEAGKDTYVAIRGWTRKLLDRMADRRDPILDFHTHHNGCQVSFLFRGKDVKKLYAAHDALSDAAAQAARLISRLKNQGMDSRQLVYEFDKETLLWAPSFAVLNDDRIITDNLSLISIEQLPKQLSLGLTKKESLASDIKTTAKDKKH